MSEVIKMLLGYGLMAWSSGVIFGAVVGVVASLYRGATRPNTFD